jgi:arsenite methyltransferase
VVRQASPPRTSSLETPFWMKNPRAFIPVSRTRQTDRVTQTVFDEGTGRQLEAMYRIGDVVRRRGLVRSALAAGPGERILDVGCGPGFLSAELSQEVGPAGSVVGVDASPAMLALAARRCQGLGNVTLHQGDATSLPVADAGFDGAVCVQVLEYVADIPAALRELYRALRPGGRVVLWDVDWATVSWHSKDPARMARVLGAWDEHLARPSLPRVLASAMRSAGFQEVRMESHPFATASFDRGSYGVAIIPMIASFVSGRGDVSAGDARAWASELGDLGERDEFYFASLQLCFLGTRPS